MPEFKEAYKILSKERERLKMELQELEIEAKTIDERREGSPFGKREEEATEAMEFEKRIALEKQLKDSLGKIDRAIQKYEDGTYGICDHCGKPIEAARLEALPSANLCLNCKVNLDKSSRSRLTR